MSFTFIKGSVKPIHRFYVGGIYSRILSGSGIESDIKQKRSKALPLGESMTSEAHPIAYGVGG